MRNSWTSSGRAWWLRAWRMTRTSRRCAPSGCPSGRWRGARAAQRIWAGWRLGKSCRPRSRCRTVSRGIWAVRRRPRHRRRVGRRASHPCTWAATSSCRPASRPRSSHRVRWATGRRPPARGRRAADYSPPVFSGFWFPVFLSPHFPFSYPRQSGTPHGNRSPAASSRKSRGPYLRTR